MPLGTINSPAPNLNVIYNLFTPTKVECWETSKNTFC